MKRTCYSWEGEDILLHKLTSVFLGDKIGTYIDVGAHHPVNMSNTKLFYDLGWSGINIDATPASMLAFSVARPRDINIEVAVTETSGVFRYATFDKPQLNGILTDTQIKQHEVRGNKLIKVVEVEGRTLADILTQHAVKEVDFMNIDIEGMEMQVLASMGGVCRPRFIIIELLNATMTGIAGAMMDPTTDILRRWGYVLFSKLHFSCIYVEAKVAPAAAQADNRWKAAKDA